MADELPEGAPVMLRMSVEQEHPYLGWLGVEMDEIDHGEATLSVPYDEKLADGTEAAASVASGVATTLLEAAGELAVRTTRPDPVNDRVETLTLSIASLDDAAGDLTATAEVVDTRPGAVVTSITVAGTDPDGDRTTVATGQGVFGVDD